MTLILTNEAAAVPEPFEETLTRRLQRWALAIGYMLRPVRIADAPVVALGTLGDLLLGAPAMPRMDQARGPAGFAGVVTDPSPQTVIDAAQAGFYPFAHMGPLKWWSPAERAIIDIPSFRMTRRLRTTLRKSTFTVTFDQDFVAVMERCAQPRPGQAPLTWITPRAKRLYRDLHEAGHAHSVEVRDAAGDLVGGLFGPAFGPVFTVLSLFHSADNASKVALLSLYHHLDGWGFTTSDHQRMSPWVEALGGVAIARADYLARLDATPNHAPIGRWTAVHSPADTAMWVPSRSGGDTASE